MSIDAFDPEILQDFLTESGELLEQLEGDLVALEETPADTELINQVFRALHTIKGSASFLALTNLVEIAHAAETALNSARNGSFSIDERAMDLLLRAVDVVRVQFGEISSGETELTKADPDLVSSLVSLGEGGGAEPSEAASGEVGGESASDAQLTRARPICWSTLSMTSTRSCGRSASWLMTSRRRRSGTRRSRASRSSAMS